MTKTAKSWTAVILAGQRPGVDRLASHFGEDWKALVPIAGEAMLTRVVRTVAATPGIARIIVLSQQPEVLADAVAAGGVAEGFAGGGGISTSLLVLADTMEAAGTPIWPAFVTTADHPLLTPEIIGQFLSRTGAEDLAVGMVERAVMQTAYPDNVRTWLKFRDGHWSGANLFALSTPRAQAALRLWSAAEQDRKTVWKLFLHFGPWLALRALTRTIGLGEGLRQAGARLGLSARLVPLDVAEAAIDVDKPSDHAEAEAILKRRAEAE
jgi:CTP:molybdopterin cytidylyltransferase MocA